jgi:hypothetical protein
MRIHDFDVSLPVDYAEDSGEMLQMGTDSSAQTQALTQVILLSAVLERTMAACSQRPIFDNSDFLSQLTKRDVPVKSALEVLGDARHDLEEWRR